RLKELCNNIHSIAFCNGAGIKHYLRSYIYDHTVLQSQLVHSHKQHKTVYKLGTYSVLVTETKAPCINKRSNCHIKSTISLPVNPYSRIEYLQEETIGYNPSIISVNSANNRTSIKG